MILCCGEALMDMLPIEAADGRQGFAPAVGGSVFNTAIALGRLGANVQFHSKISSDDLGQKLLNALAESHVGTDPVVTSVLPCPLAMVHLQDGHASYQFYDEGTAAQDFTADEKPHLPNNLKMAFFGGISLLGHRSGPYYRRLMAQIGQLAPVMLDPNIRPGFIQDEASYRAELDEMFGHASILKVSDEDLDWIAGKRSVEATLAHILRLGTRLILITKGGDGVEAVSKHVQLDVPSTPAQVVDTVGAGDTFSAGFLCALQEQELFGSLLTLSEEQLTRAIELGAKAAAVTVSRHGANPPWRQEISG
ncbi:carbohydrate kinase family protein [Maritalea mediterranea]|uniref:Carbohydrate kinase n=1 Tax=Maritalea mediterranea TaxID=2909667 RepID=A0ABS9E646_9HYPH|nr:carbohydrate kinase [Maritalea mediterranea]MCF4097687.1 carbohydrate kinase [Maritalea mediterranea]